MEGRFRSSRLISDPEDYENATESGPESPPSTLLHDMKMTSTSSPKRSKRGIQKRVVSVPIKDVEGSRLKGENSTPPSDSWAWRKYGQKPIKGSPYPRGYYRCSSSKGCPARKQVERSKVDPTMLVVTYSCDHNHMWPLPARTSHHRHNPNTPTTELTIDHNLASESIPEEPEENKFAELGGPDESSVSLGDEFGWFGGMETASCVMLESSMLSETASTRRTSPASEADVSVFFPMREEDESLFADLGELPECTAVFRVGPQVQIC